MTSEASRRAFEEWREKEYGQDTNVRTNFILEDAWQAATALVHNSCTRAAEARKDSFLSLELAKYANPQFREGYRTGICVAADWISQWDRQLATSVDGYRFSDILLCKFNLVKRKYPRKVGKPAPMDRG